MTRTILQAFGIALLGVTFGCTEQPMTLGDDKHDKDDDDPIGDTVDKPTQPEDVTGDEENTFDHMPELGTDDTRDPYDIAKQHEEEGSPEVRARLHSCQKVQIQTLRNMLT